MRKFSWKLSMDRIWLWVIIHSNGWLCALAVSILLGIAASGCKDDDEPLTVKDIDGNVYKTIKIGNQVWMAENLKVTLYRNGDPIPNVTGHGTWGDLTTGAYCNYNNDTQHVNTHGRLYNWYAVSDYREIAPEGWHIPTQAEWETLVEHLGENAVEKLQKENGFHALRSGVRESGYGFYNMGQLGVWWTGTSVNSANAKSWLVSSNAIGNTTYTKVWGFSVRCVRD
jgi:uncharacterized protein (TIGR02145 family)